jgi:hypothetical protein
MGSRACEKCRKLQRPLTRLSGNDVLRGELGGLRAGEPVSIHRQELEHAE